MARSRRYRNHGGRWHRPVRAHAQPAPSFGTGWRMWAAVTYSLVASALLVVCVAGFAIASITEIGGFDPQWLPSPVPKVIVHGGLLGVALSLGSMAVWGVLGWTVGRLGIVKLPPLVLYPLAWLLNADERLDRRIRGRDR